MRTLQEWMGHRDYQTTLVYADFAPDPAQGAAFAERAFGPPVKPGPDRPDSIRTTGGAPDEGVGQFEGRAKMST
jgi:hypothetical protein